MISFRFEVDDEPPHSGFSLGHLDVVGSLREVTTRGTKNPDERMWVYLAASQLLWDVRVLAENPRGSRRFVGMDSSFALCLRVHDGRVTTLHEKTKIDVSPLPDFLDAVLESAVAIYASGVENIEEDRKPLTDLERAITRFQDRHRQDHEMDPKRSRRISPSQLSGVPG